MLPIPGIVYNEGVFGRLEVSMSAQTFSDRTEFVQKLEAAWAELESCLAALSESQMTEFHDDQGWSVKDHITHLAAWEESMAMLFQGKPRHQTLGIELPKFSGENIDKINAAIRERWKPLSIGTAIQEFRSIHTRFLRSVKGLSEADLNQPVGLFFPQTPPGEERRVFELLQANTTDHYLEHLPWINKLVKTE